MNTAVNSIAWLTPSAPTMARSWVAARTSRPNRVRVSTRCSDHQDHRAHRDQHQVVARKAAAEYVDRAAQAGRARAEQVFRAPQPQRRVVDHENEREGGEQLEQFGHVIDAPQQHHFDHRAERADAERRGDDAAPESDPAADSSRDRLGEIEPTM